MQIHELKPKHKNKDKKRVGRGGKRGTTAGRGQKGQKSRAGRRIKPAEKYLIQKFPKLRGFKNKSKKEIIVIKTSELEKISVNGKINKEILKNKKIIKKNNDLVKILYDKDPGKAFVISGIPLSKKAKEIILKNNGTIN